MLNRLRQLFRPAPEPAPPAIGPGERVYAVGDIHGRLDLLEPLVAAIEADDGGRGPAETTLVLLGDLVDRGPDSAGVISFARDLAARRRVRILAGNHEEMFLGSLDKLDTLRHFIKHGGRETILSYPVEPSVYRELTLEETQGLVRAIVPEADLAFMRGFEDRFVIGDYLFVHAGIMPGVPLEAQKTEYLRWMREPFLSFKGDHGWCVVHGHTITDDVVVTANRIGIDTGAYASGRLTTLGLEGTARWLIQAVKPEDGPVAIERREL
ncbi:MAG TPA: metallophosphoesterase family protein [Novosphingobium sp.]|nr:metallophosphoesterase family protein [Novosphingobium sp.]